MKCKYFLWKSFRWQSFVIFILLTFFQIDMEEIERAYKAMYGVSLIEAIESECGGDYKKMLIALVKMQDWAASHDNLLTKPACLNLTLDYVWVFFLNKYFKLSVLFYFYVFYIPILFIILHLIF